LKVSEKLIRLVSDLLLLFIDDWPTKGSRTLRWRVPSVPLSLS